MLYLHLFLADLKMIYRNRQALFWALVFPLIFVVIFGVFRLDEPTPVPMAIVDQAKDNLSTRLTESLKQIELLKLNTTLSEDEARKQLGDGDLKYVLIIPRGLGTQVTQGQASSVTLLYDEAQVQTNQLVLGVIKQFLDEVNLAMQGGRHVLQMNPQGIQAKQVGYFDFLLPGFVGMGVMTFAIIGVAAQLALYRQQRILKRIKATPLPVAAFFVAQIAAWLVLSLVQAAIIVSAGMLLFHARVYGNLLWVFPLIVLANVTFLNLGFIVGSLAKTVEAANGLGNAVSMPMMFLSGVFFPTDGLPAALRETVRFLPLTPLLKAMRGVMLDARVPWDYPWELLILITWVLATSIVAVRVFRFE